MTPSTDSSLIERRQALRGQIRRQREIVAQQLDSSPKANGYPRSATMRFLTHRPALTAGVVAGVAGLLVRARFFKSLTMAVGMFKVVRSMTASRK